MFEHNRTTPCIPCYLITDAEGLSKYGLGMVRMGSRRLQPYLADGYLVAADSLASLAARLNIDAANLQATVADMNRFAETGLDPQFGRGTTAYHRVNGDASHAPNPTLGPIRTAPFYAVRLYPGDIGAANGLVIDEEARVTKSDDTPIGRLYACGAEAASIMGGTYPGPGITIGPAIVMAYRAVQDALRDESGMSAAERHCDLVVVGSGAGGLAAATTAAWLGLDVIVVEKAAVVGGTTAWSGGWMWIPRNPLAIAEGLVEDEAAPRLYLQHELGSAYDEAFVTTYLREGPRMVAFFRAHTSLDFVSGSRIPDFHDRSPGAGAGGRSVCAAPFDGRALGRRIKLLRPPLEEVAPFGMGIASGADMQHFFRATRSWRSFAHVARRVLRHQAERLACGRGLWLVGGNALVARLLKSADDLKVTILTETPARAPILEKGRVAGVVVGEGERILARRRRGAGDRRLSTRRRAQGGDVCSCADGPRACLRRAGDQYRRRTQHR